ncbi:DNA-binding response regulator [Streptomyces pathocidini]|uniref:DNA-binding response regulator n=1 Tax=Streptomyces pathocidini TaxID=1650571 RepID=A0ABW7UUT8_9ACTN|nr:response regulator transcription factor [Streptomyces pathocidini]
MIRVLIAEDMDMVREALVARLSIEPDIEVVAEVHRGDAVFSVATAVRPDVVVQDMVMPGAEGTAVCAALQRALPTCRVLIISAIDHPATLRSAVRAGAHGFLTKGTSATQLVAAIRDIHAGKRVLDPSLASEAMRLDENPLTPRERGILQLASEGYSSPQIAASLQLAVGTVRNYLTEIRSKLGARTRVDAVRIARENRWL